MSGSNLYNCVDIYNRLFYYITYHVSVLSNRGYLIMIIDMSLNDPITT